MAPGARNTLCYETVHFCCHYSRITVVSVYKSILKRSAPSQHIKLLLIFVGYKSCLHGLFLFLLATCFLCDLLFLFSIDHLQYLLRTSFAYGRPSSVCCQQYCVTWLLDLLASSPQAHLFLLPLLIPILHSNTLQTFHYRICFIYFTFHFTINLLLP